MTIEELYANNPERWTQGNTARDANGHKVGVHSKKAVSWCMAKAICKCYPISRREEVFKKLRIAIKQVLGKDAFKNGNGWISWSTRNGVNDNIHRTFEQVMDIVRTAKV